jgi:hypothetical protein
MSYNYMQVIRVCELQPNFILSDKMVGINTLMYGVYIFIIINNYYLNFINHGGISVVCFSKGRAYKNVTCLETTIIYKISLYI